jgi:hypothetical protein
MRVSALAFLSAFALSAGAALAEEVKSGPPAGKKGISAFNIKAVTGSDAGKTYCQV